MKLNDSIITTILNALSLEQLEAIVNQKKQELKPERLSFESQWIAKFEKNFKAKLYPPQV